MQYHHICKLYNNYSNCFYFSKILHESHGDSLLEVVLIIYLISELISMYILISGTKVYT